MMNKLELLQQLNASYALENMLSLERVETEKDLKAAKENGYFVDFTKESWAKRFPFIPADKVFFYRGLPIGALYYDAKHYIVLELPVYGNEVLTVNGEDFEQTFKKSVESSMELYKNKQWSRLLQRGFSEASGGRLIPVILNILHNEEPSGELYSLFLNYYTSCDSGASFLKENDIDKLLVCKTAAQKQKTSEAMKDLPDEITVYRGVGSESTAAHKAVSWTLNINAAYFFGAWRCVDGVKVYKGTVKKENVIEYITDRNEAEILVKLGTVVIDNNATVYCTDWDFFIETVKSPYVMFDNEERMDKSIAGAAILTDVDKIYAKAKQSNDADSIDHDIEHTERVALMASFIFRMEAERMGTVSADDMWKAFKSLLTAAKWHDIGRSHDGIDRGHGKKSAEIFRSLGNKDSVAEFLMEYHCRSDKEAKTYLNTHFAGEDKELIWLDYQILKDADALDRWRFGYGCQDFVDVKSLHLETSKELMAVAAYFQNVDMG